MAGDGSRLEAGRPERACVFDPRSFRKDVYLDVR